MARARSKALFYCVVMPTKNARNTIGAVYGCSNKREVAMQHLERAINRGAKSLRLDTTFHPPRGYGKWLEPAH